MSEDGSGGDPQEGKFEDDDIPDWAVPRSREDDASSESSGGRWRRDSPSPEPGTAAGDSRAHSTGGKGKGEVHGRGTPPWRQKGGKPTGKGLRPPSRPLIRGQTPRFLPLPQLRHPMPNPMIRAGKGCLAMRGSLARGMMTAGVHGISAHSNHIRPGQAMIAPTGFPRGHFGPGTVPWVRGAPPPGLHGVRQKGFRGIAPPHITTRHARPPTNPAGSGPRANQTALAVRAGRPLGPNQTSVADSLSHRIVSLKEVARQAKIRNNILRVQNKGSGCKGISKGSGCKGITKSGLKPPGQQHVLPPRAAMTRFGVGRGSLWRGVAKHKTSATQAEILNRAHPAGLSPAIGSNQAAAERWQNEQSSGGRSSRQLMDKDNSSAVRPALNNPRTLQQDEPGTQAAGKPIHSRGRKRSIRLVQSSNESPGATAKSQAKPAKVHLQRNRRYREDNVKRSKTNTREQRSRERSHERDSKRARYNHEERREVIDLEVGDRGRAVERVDRTSDHARPTERFDRTNDHARPTERIDHAGPTELVDRDTPIERVHQKRPTERSDRTRPAGEASSSSTGSKQIDSLQRTHQGDYRRDVERAERAEQPKHAPGWQERKYRIERTSTEKSEHGSQFLQSKKTERDDRIAHIKKRLNAERSKHAESNERTEIRRNLEICEHEGGQQTRRVDRNERSDVKPVKDGEHSEHGESEDKWRWTYDKDSHKAPEPTRHVQGSDRSERSRQDSSSRYHQDKQPNDRRSRSRSPARTRQPVGSKAGDWDSWSAENEEPLKRRNEEEPLKRRLLAPKLMARQDTRTNKRDRAKTRTGAAGAAPKKRVDGDSDATFFSSSDASPGPPLRSGRGAARPQSATSAMERGASMNKVTAHLTPAVQPDTPRHVARPSSAVMPAVERINAIANRFQ